MKYSGPKCRLCRREGEKLFLKGDKCVTTKCILTKRAFAPGQHSKTRGKPTEYSRQLRAKQKAKRIYNVTETQFENYYTKAVAKKGVVTGDLLLTLLESRLDNVIYRAGLASSRSQARQYISHGLFKVNGRRVTVASIQAKPGDILEPTEHAKGSQTLFAEKESATPVPGWMSVDPKARKVTIERGIEKDELPTGEMDAQLIVEYYSR